MLPNLHRNSVKAYMPFVSRLIPFLFKFFCHHQISVRKPRFQTSKSQWFVYLAAALFATHGYGETNDFDIERKPLQDESSQTAAPTTNIVTTQAAPDEPLVVYTPTNDSDLWARIRRGFGMNGLDQTELVSQHEQWYSSRPDYINRMTGRSNKYLYHVVEEREAQHANRGWLCCHLLKALSIHKRCQVPKLLACGNSCLPLAGILL